VCRVIPIPRQNQLLNDIEIRRIENCWTVARSEFASPLQSVSMQLQAHFHDIQGAITRHLKAVQSEILAAVTWLTDREMFDVLCQFPSVRPG
jgi:hypothetical protein